MKIPNKLFRTASFDIGAIDVEARTIELSLSSDQPYKRYFGNEVLDHSPECVNLTRMQTGAAMLFNHDTGVHLGKFLSCQTDGKTLRAKAQIGENADAENRWKDIQSGVLHQASIGYMVGAMKLEEENEKDGDTYRVTAWEPYEGSLVTVAADPTVGIGRSAENGLEFREITIDNLQKKKEKTTMPAEPPVIDEVKTREDAVKTERSRVSKINGFMAAFKVEGMRAKATDLARSAIENGVEFDAFRASVLDNWDEVKAIETPDPKIGMSKKEIRQYSLTRAIHQIGIGKGLSGLELEVHEATAKHLKRSDSNGFLIPDDISTIGLDEARGLSRNEVSNASERCLEIAAHAMRQLNGGNRRALNATTAGSGGYLIGTELLTGSIIGLLRNRCVLNQLGITHLSGLVGNIAIPKVTGGATCYWLSETGTTTESSQTFQQLGMTPHCLTADTAYSKELVAQVSLSVEAFVRDDLARQMAVEKDRAGFNGNGVNGQPLGLLLTTGITSETFSTSATWAKIVDFETQLGKSNADTLGMPVWVTTPGTRGKWKTNVKVSNFPVFLWSDDNTVNGYSAIVTNNIPGDQVIFGVFSEFIMADWAGIDVVVDPFSLKKSGQIETVVSMWTDNGLRHEPAFVVSSDSGAQ